MVLLVTALLIESCIMCILWIKVNINRENIDIVHDHIWTIGERVNTQCIWTSGERVNTQCKYITANKQQ